MERLQIYSCNKCGNMVELIHVGGGNLTCCDQSMEALKENTTDAAQEKHVPVIEKSENGYRVLVGSVAHPMEDSHYIEWVELIADGRAYRKFLNPGEKPVTEFAINADKVSAREYCNLHGLWKKE